MSKLSGLTQNPMTYFMIVIFGIMLYVASTYPAEARFMPFVVGFPALLLCFLQLFLDLRATDAKTQDNRSDMEKAEARVSQMTGRQMEFDAADIAPAFTVSENPTAVVRSRELLIWGYLLAFMGGILVFGFYAAVPVFLLLYLHKEAGFKLARAVLFSVVGSGIMLGALTWGLKLQLHAGFVTSMLLDKL